MRYELRQAIDNLRYAIDHLDGCDRKEAVESLDLIEYELNSCLSEME